MGATIGRICSCVLLATFLLTAVLPVYGQQQYVAIGDLALISGQTVNNCRLGYRTQGHLNDDKSNIVVVPTWFSGTTGDLENFQLIGPGKIVDTNHFYVISIDSLGNGVSCSPSNSDIQPGRDFPPIAIVDMVTSQHRLLTEHLDIHHVKAVMGISMGGMQTYRWIIEHPDFMDKAVPIIGTPRQTSYDLLQWQLYERVIRMLQDDGRSHEDIASVVAPLSLLTLSTPENVVTEVPRSELPDYVKNRSKNYADTDWNDVVAQLQAMIGHDVLANGVDAYVKEVVADVLIVGISSDHMVNPIPGRELAPELGASYMEVDTACGHVGTGCKAEDIARAVTAFLLD